MPQPVKLDFSSPKRGLPPKHFADLSDEQRIAALAELGLPKFRANQIARHYYERYEADPSTMTDLPADARDKVAEALFPQLMTHLYSKETDDGHTSKSLWRLHDGTLLESVVMRYPNRATLCISSQAGCGMNCPFCATGQGGLDRNLSVAEMTEQVRHAAKTLAAEGSRLSNIVFMGMGEPLANYKRVKETVSQIIAPGPKGFGISARNVTVSTVGLAPAIRKLADEQMNVTLAVSLHTPDDEFRDTLVPVNNRWSVEEVLSAAKYYVEKTSRRVSIEYALIRDKNDQDWRADLLGEKLWNALGTKVHVNVIPLNPTPGSEWDASPKDRQDEFVRRVSQWVPCTVRDTKGQEIAAACGQLAAEEEAGRKMEAEARA
ncbi:23S rRNA (adenine(2503)-C(2))-methyltransferase RlmN [Corynebacterium pseudodiphtheriticum]|uniref:23S rRNA (adenine(2503)-C(2))-methyltransferase RlmN n=1 Tax=Corynebacterium pseudodiphtheriticum TaxID=37637 RepID=UPI00201C6E84|nr:23S rRNA (adenine(2503)-C(2))-methyltransferase RlmN [Corynebacterium pseudodiphtheriticum]MDC7088114.1 23S rRNA (adenine(2503)-C(2))-methyltransferase RlmN [Corynebacterium pseudodiphtheriticum]MDK4241306.1 23S rRNA (adenine(2503)-C(2))-methyltransferase RlmN [Corynebacterium pseudodiphtheriticum]MDK4321050.1 23S rRNA (adenine(2503)-C(2))-methyltransferase RlmN [Corynebacterium pseudodiphtheriticum]MDK8477555.1 23S rRNA (adenine(2503)-C(2))-methyltransferase RlmN [Corynebacterium pseudodiph